MPRAHHLLPTRSPRRALTLGLAGLALMCGFSGRAAAQAEAESPAPNVLLLIDNSGSMEFKIDGAFPKCVPNDLTVNQKSRWIELVEVLTGRFNNYSCWAQDRSTSAFRDEFSINGVAPYDFGYVNPYHRALSSSCLVGPGVLPSPNIFSFPDKAVNTFTLAPSNTVTRPAIGLLPTFAGCAAFSQQEDGLLDVFKKRIRFGLMTFDARVNPGVGYTPDMTYSSAAIPDYSAGMDGNWSYHLPGSPATGHPINCSFEVDHEVGARNPAAPPWEGRMIAFGSPTQASNDQRNAWIQQTLLATRPYGATPINGQLYDARDFLFNEGRSDPLTPADPLAKFGPKDDKLWRANDCRKTILILLTDGEPNLDLRPYCDMTAIPPDTAGRCPYPEDSAKVVRSLRLSPPVPSMSVETYVVGFAMGKAKPYGATEAVECNKVSLLQCDAPENKDFDKYPDGKQVQACCRLNEIAAAGRPVDANGKPAEAFFADSSDKLRSIFVGILDQVTRAATRTTPVLDGGGDGSNKGFKFTASFQTLPPLKEDSALWAGRLKRQRFVCDSSTLKASEVNIDQTAGDDFAYNLNQNKGQRQFFSVVGAGGVGSRKSIRPEVTTNTDGLGLSDGATIHATSPGALAPLIPATAMDLVDNISCTSVSANACRTRVLNHLVGEPNDENKSRCYADGCRLLGAIVHSTPTIVSGQPQELLRDESYEKFVKAMAVEERHSVLYTSTVDGMLHAFDVAPYPGSATAATTKVDDSSLNELWSFIPPAVLPSLRSQYPDLPTVLLDGAPVIKDVISRTSGLTTRFERLQSDALAGNGDWRTVLVQSFGDSSVVDGGYFALDVTKPELEPGDGPRFLWQLTRSTTDARLFGNGGTPLITTVFLKSGTEPPREVAVAVLPGGDATPSGSGTVGATPLKLDVDPPEYVTKRATGLNYTGLEKARSLTIVRLDTGEVVRTFRPSGTGFDSSVYTFTDIPAPITGQPAAFPPNTGAVADRIFVGDRDGRLWRVDVSSQNPANWSMKVLFDAFYDDQPSQPVVLAPMVSTDDDGAVTVAFATGDQQVTAAPSGMLNRVISLTERLDTVSNSFEAKVNWVHTLTDGYRVTGPMALYNRALYYAASRPPDASGTTCNRGSAKVFGAHYIEAKTPTALTDGPQKAPGESNLQLDAREPGMIFGVSMQPDPTCKAGTAVVGGDDSFGYGLVQMSTRANEGQRFLAYSVSGATKSSSPTPGTREKTNDEGIREVEKKVASPDMPVTFGSWALLYE